MSNYTLSTFQQSSKNNTNVCTSSNSFLLKLCGTSYATPSSASMTTLTMGLSGSSSSGFKAMSRSMVEQIPVLPITNCINMGPGTAQVNCIENLISNSLSGLCSGDTGQQCVSIILNTIKSDLFTILQNSNYQPGTFLKYLSSNYLSCTISNYYVEGLVPYYVYNISCIGTNLNLDCSVKYYPYQLTYQIQCNHGLQCTIQTNSKRSYYTITVTLSNGTTSTITI